MPIRVKTNLLPLAALLAFAACGQPDPADEDIARVGGDGEEGPVTAAGADAEAEAISSCLDQIWDAQTEEQRAFDRSHDEIGGVSISCGMSTTASQFVEALDALRAAAEAEDRAAILDALNIPFYYIDAGGKTRQLDDRDEINRIFDDIFDERIMTLLKRLDLAEVTVVPGEGAFLELGSLWLVADHDGGQPKIVTVNHEALGEAETVRAEVLESEADD